jgi:hypothetical protein
MRAKIGNTQGFTPLLILIILKVTEVGVIFFKDIIVCQHLEKIDFQVPLHSNMAS